jgi:hypothetical protein
MQSRYPLVRRAHRVIRMVSDLHRMGYQRLRVMPYLHPMAYRIAIAPVECFIKANGVALEDEGLMRAAIYSSASENQYFDWTDAKSHSSLQLAEKFVERFPDLSKSGMGADWGYAGWLADLVGFLGTGDWLPVVRSEYASDEQLRDLTALPISEWTEAGLTPGREFPLPIQT